MQISEKDLQQYVMQRCKMRGILCDKLESRSRRGWPDLLLMYKGLIVFAEIKRPGSGRLSLLQQRCHDDIKDHGGAVVTISSQFAADSVIEGLIDAG